MVGAITSVGSVYRTPYLNRVDWQSRQKASSVENAAAVRPQVTTTKRAQPGVPVQPAEPVTPVRDRTFNKEALMHYMSADPAEKAVRSRIKYLGAEEEDEPKIDIEETPDAQEVAEESECQTCKKRKYQDGSDDPGVSFKTPTSVDPKMAQSAVRGHENEHVIRERAKALQEDRKVISQSVTYRNAICPECGKVYLAGGTTRTVTVNQPKPYEPPEDKNESGKEWESFSIFA